MASQVSNRARLSSDLREELEDYGVHFPSKDSSPGINEERKLIVHLKKDPGEIKTQALFFAGLIY